MHSIRKVRLPLHGLDDLVSEASAQGHTFLDELQQDWATGRNDFSAEGEAFYAVFDQQLLVAVGALSHDPFLNAPGIGRLRRIYVRAAWRRQGIASALVTTMLADARRHFQTVRLRAQSPAAARVYQALGFQPCIDEQATHTLQFEP